MSEWNKKFNLYALSHVNSRWSALILFVFAFFDASLFPLPVATTFLLLIIMDNTKYVRYLVSSTLGTFAGAVTGYLIGHFLLMNAHTASTPGFMQFLPSHLHGLSENIFNSTQAFYSKYNFWILFTASFTPIHYGLFSISAGIFKTNIIVFCFVTLLSQSLKFYLLAVVTTKLSLKAKMMFKLNLKPAIVIASICLALALLITRVL